MKKLKQKLNLVGKEVNPHGFQTPIYSTYQNLTPDAIIPKHWRGSTTPKTSGALSMKTNESRKVNSDGA